MYFKLNQQNIGNWKFTLLMYLSAFLSVIFMSIVIIANGIFDFEIMSDDNGSGMGKIKAILIYFIPAIVLNYFLLIYNNRYEELLKKYQPENGKYIIYFMCFALTMFVISLAVM